MSQQQYVSGLRLFSTNINTKQQQQQVKQVLLALGVRKDTKSLTTGDTYNFLLIYNVDAHTEDHGSHTHEIVAGKTSPSARRELCMHA